MKADELEKDNFYWCEFLQDWVKYCGAQRYQESIHYNFFRAGTGFFYWLNPKEVQPNKDLDDGFDMQVIGK